MPSHLSENKRAIIIHLHKNGKSQREISRETSCSRNGVQVTIKRWLEEGTLKERDGRGRKKRVTSRVERRLVRLSMANRHLTSPELSRELELSTGTKLASSTVRRVLRENGLKGCKARKKPLVSEQQRKARVEWARQHANWTVDDWKKVLFSDESTFTIQNHRGNAWVRRRPGEEYKANCILPTIKHPVGVMVWGCFAASGAGRLHIVNGTMNAIKYCGVLENSMLKSAEDLFEGPWVFQQDNAPCHTARIVKEWMGTHNVSNLKWPAVSPDLNPIENLWSKMGTLVSKHKPRNKIALIEVIIKSWFRIISPDLLQRLVSSMPTRCQAVINSNGWPTKY